MNGPLLITPRTAFRSVGSGGSTAAPVPPTPARGKLPFLPRVPDPSDTRRLARATEQLSSIINSLIAKGQLVQTGPESWKIVP